MKGDDTVPELVAVRFLCGADGGIEGPIDGLNVGPEEGLLLKLDFSRRRSRAESKVPTLD